MLALWRSFLQEFKKSYGMTQTLVEWNQTECSSASARAQGAPLSFAMTARTQTILPFRVHRRPIMTVRTGFGGIAMALPEMSLIGNSRDE